MRKRTLPGKYTVGTWMNLEASEAQEQLRERGDSGGGLLVVKCRYEEGADFPEHFHQQEQITIVEQGTLEFVLDGESVKVSAGEMISILPGVPHRTRVVGRQAVVALNLFHSMDTRTSSIGRRRKRSGG